jgi:hypothetical protein
MHIEDNLRNAFSGRSRAATIASYHGDARENQSPEKEKNDCVNEANLAGGMHV